MRTLVRRVATFMAAAAAFGIAACGGNDISLPSDRVASKIAAVSGANQNGTAGAPLPAPVVVKVTDAQGRDVSGQQVSFTVTGGSGTVSPASAATDANGQASTQWTLGPAAGANQMRAQAVGGGASATVVVDIGATAGAGAAAKLAALSGNNQTGTAGAPLTDSIAVLVTDAADNPVAGVGVQWTVTGGGSVSAATVPTGADGHSAVKRVLGSQVGTQTTIAAVAGLTNSPVTFTATATVGSAGQLTITTQPSSSAQSGAAFAQQPRLQLRDAGGNPVSQAGLAVTASIATGPAGGTLVGNPIAATNGQGLAIFSGLGITGSPGIYTLNFIGANLSGATSSGVTLAAGAPARLAFAVQPSAAAAGGVITPPVQVAVEDAQGNAVPGATNNVTVAIGSNPSGGVLSGTKTVAAVNGVATFSNLSIDKVGSGYTIAASSSGLQGATSTAFNVTSGGAGSISIRRGDGQSAPVGTAVPIDPSILVTNANGVGVPGVNVDFAVASGGGSITGGAQTTDANGFATVGNWTLGPSTGANTLTATAAGAGISGNPVTFTATGLAGSANKVLIQTQPAATATSGVPLTTQPQVHLVDANDNPVATSGLGVTATIASGPAATLSNATATTAGGQANFSGLTINGPAGTYTLSFGGSGLVPATSNPIALAAGGATKLVILTQPPGNVQAGVPFATHPVIQVQDAAGNPVNVSRNIVVALDSGSGTLGGTKTLPTNGSSSVTFTDLRIDGPLGINTLQFAASGAGIAPVGSIDIAVTPGPVSGSASQVTVIGSPITASSGSSQATVRVTAKDGSGNLVSNAAVTVTISGSGNVVGSSPATGSNGESDTPVSSTEAGSKTVSASAGGVAISGTTNLVVQPAPVSAAQSPLVVAPTSVNAAGSVTLTVHTRDVFGNTVSNAGNVVGFAVTGSNSANPSVTDHGNGTYTASYNPQTAGSDQVSATVGGAAAAQSPQTVAVSAGAADPASSTHNGPTSATFGAPVTITVQVRDQFNNPVTAASVALTVNGGAAVSATDNGDGSYSVQYDPVSQGATDTVNIMVGGVSIQNSPFSVTVN